MKLYRVDVEGADSFYVWAYGMEQAINRALNLLGPPEPRQTPVSVVCLGVATSEEDTPRVIGRREEQQ